MCLRSVRGDIVKGFEELGRADGKPDWRFEISVANSWCCSFIDSDERVEVRCIEVRANPGFHVRHR